MGIESLKQRAGAPIPDFIVELVDEGFVARRKGQYDIVMMWHVLEHVIDPLELLRLAGALLKPGGILCVEVPNADDDLMRMSPSFRTRSHVVEHISYFSPATLENAAVRSGFGTNRVTGYQRYGIFNYFHWIHFNKPQGANPDLFEGKDRWWLEASWRATRKGTLTSDAILLVARDFDVT